MKTIIAGSRNLIDYNIMLDGISKINWFPTEIVSGHARGADMLGEQWAKENNIKLTLFPAAWETYGRKAGMIRNTVMAKYADALLAFWDGKSKGTKHMIDLAKKKKLRIHIVIFETNISIVNGSEQIIQIIKEQISDRRIPLF